MKLKYKLAISFCMIIFVPALCILLIALVFQSGGFTLIPHVSEFQSTIRSYPEWRDVMIDFAVCVVLILLLTAITLSVWLYQSIVSPLRKLQIATKHIKDGDLDFSLDAVTDDEIGELSRDFEEMRLRLKESAEEKVVSEAENRELVRNISHDLKTPITAIKGYAEGLIDGVADTSEKKEKYIRTILSKATEMTTLLNELTLYAEIDQNRIPYNFTKLPVTSYFNDCAEEIGIELETKGIAFRFFTDVAPEVAVIADPEQITRVIHNIVNNSVKYSNKSEAFVSVRVRDVGDFVQVEIEDNGKGIDIHSLPYIFDRFYRTDESRNSLTGGSGIGLSIAKKIVEDHGGKIWATSKVGFGTTMYFVLRRYTEPEPETVIDVG